MSARIVWWVMTLGILTVFQLSVTKEQHRCRSSHGCVICKFPKATKDHCLVRRHCFNRFRFENPVCIKYDHEKEKRTRGTPPPENYIVGGSPTNEGNWPWQVSLQTSSYDRICGGVLIDNDWVLTAAHCVHKRFRLNAKDFIVVLGEFDLKRRSGKEQFQRIKHIFVHPNFHPRSKKVYDVALIQMANDAHYNEYVSPISLPSSNDVYVPNSCFITGWGETRGTGDKSRLRVLEVTLIDWMECKNVDPKIHICVNYSLKGSCSGDSSGPLSGSPLSGGPLSGGPLSGGPLSGGPLSGGPLSGGPLSGRPLSGGPLSGGPLSGDPLSGGPLSCVRRSDGRFVVAGVASSVQSPCQKPGSPSIYTNIRTIVTWINNIMHSNKKKP